MLKRSYNWIRNHVTPPSLLFRNRLFIERDSNHHRVLFTFGLTFRNSKWSDYRRSNVSGSLVRDFKAMIGWIFVISVSLLTLISFAKYGLLFNLTTKGSSLIWFLGDFYSYLHIVAFSLWLFSVQLSAETVHSATLGLLLPQSYSTTARTSTQLSPNKLDNRRVLYAWLTSSQSRTSEDLELVYRASLDNSGSVHLRDANFFKSLFTASSALSNAGRNLSSVASTSRSSFGKLSEDELSRGGDFLLRPNVALGLLNPVQPARGSAQPSLWALNSRMNWATSASLAESSSSEAQFSPNSAPRGSFYIPVTDFTSLMSSTRGYSELSGLTDSLQQQVTSAKWSRWLYKYNLLHRKSVLNSHKNTMTKRLLGSGFYDSSFFARNPNSKSILSAHTNPNEFFNRGFLETYANFLPSGTSSLNQLSGLQLDYASQMSYYESSYFWFLKRFYLFNSLHSTGRVSQVQLRQVQNSTAGMGTTGTNLILAQQRAAHSKDLRYFDVLRSLSMHVSSEERPYATSSTLENLSVSTDMGDIFDYDFTESALSLLTNSLSLGHQSAYYSNLGYTSNKSADQTNSFLFRGI